MENRKNLSPKSGFAKFVIDAKIVKIRAKKRETRHSIGRVSKKDATIFFLEIYKHKPTFLHPNRDRARVFKNHIEIWCFLPLAWNSSFKSYRGPSSGQISKIATALLKPYDFKIPAKVLRPKKTKIFKKKRFLKNRRPPPPQLRQHAHMWLSGTPTPPHMCACSRSHCVERDDRVAAPPRGGLRMKKDPLFFFLPSFFLFSPFLFSFFPLPFLFPPLPFLFLFSESLFPLRLPFFFPAHRSWAFSCFRFWKLVVSFWASGCIVLGARRWKEARRSLDKSVPSSVSYSSSSPKQIKV